MYVVLIPSRDAITITDLDEVDANERPGPQEWMAMDFHHGGRRMQLAIPFTVNSTLTVDQLTCLIGIAGYWLLVDFPDGRHKSWNFLGQREIQFIIDRVQRDRGDVKTEPFSLGKFLRPALDLKIWGFAMCFLYAFLRRLCSAGLGS